MDTTLVDQFLKHDMRHHAQGLGIAPTDFKPEPSVFEPHPPEACSLRIVRFREGYAVLATPEWKERVTTLLRTTPWREWLDAPQGLDELLAALGLEAMDTTDRPGAPKHDIALLCNGARFRPYENHAQGVIRLTPEHPLWADPDAAPKWPFKYVIVEKGRVVAQAIMKHNLDVLGGRTWALGVAVKPEHRRKGYGKAVVSAATRQVVEEAGLALWNARANNVASLTLCQALGYEKFFWELFIPKDVPEQEP